MNWQSFTELEYLLLGLVAAVPSFLIPLLFVGKVNYSLGCFRVSGLEDMPISFSVFVIWCSKVLSFAG